MSGQFLGQRTMRLGEIIKPGGWRELMKDPRVIALGASIRAHGLIAPPVIRKSDKTIVAGRERVAAYDVLKADSIDVRLWEGSDEEARRVELEENVRRKHLSRDDRDAMLRELSAFYAASEFSGQSGQKNTASAQKERHGRGRPPGKTQKRLAREKAAEGGGVSERTVRRAEAARNSDVQAEAAGTAAPVPPCVRDFGVGVPPLLDSRLRAYQAVLDYVEQQSKNAQGKLTGAEFDFVDWLPQALKTAAKALGAAARAEYPETICPWCKALAKARTTDCNACDGRGWLPKDRCNTVPKELLNSGESAVVAIDGVMRKVSDL